MRILITGGNGFIGSRLVRSALEQGYGIVLLKRSTSNLSRIRDLVDQITFYDWDKIDELDQILVNEEISVVIHLASAYIKVDKSEAERKMIYQTNVILADRLLQACIKAKVSAFINTGTFFEFKAGNDFLSENSPKKPFNYYAKTKIQFEKLLGKAVAKKQIKGITLRPFSPYGPGDNRTVTYLMIRALLNKNILSLTNSSQLLSFTYVDDIAKAYLKAIVYLINSNIAFKYQDFNIGCSTAYSVKEIGQILEDIMPDNKGLLQYNFGEVIQFLCDNRKANKILDWQPHVNIIEGLANTYKYHLSLSEERHD